MVAGATDPNISTTDNDVGWVGWNGPSPRGVIDQADDNAACDDAKEPPMRLRLPVSTAPRPVRRRTSVVRICALLAAALVTVAFSGVDSASAATSGVPFGHLDSVRSGSTGVTVTGWAIDPDTYSPISVTLSADGHTLGTTTANTERADVARAYGKFGGAHGFAPTYVLSSGVHQVCATARNAGPAGADKSLGCLAVTVSTNPAGYLNPVPTRTWSNMISVSGWAADPQTSAAISVAISIDGAAPVTVLANRTVAGLPSSFAASTAHGFFQTFSVSSGVQTVSVVALNVGLGSSVSIGTATVPAVGVPPAVTSPALISTSRYIRDITGASSDAARTRAMGAADGAANPSGHAYLSLLQVGGQTSTGVILTATSIYVSYAGTVAAMEAYLDGYASTQRSSAPATIAFGTNNDIDVSTTDGEVWARSVINPLVSYAKRYPNITIAGADDIEPGFIGSVSESTDWVTGYLSATSAKFVFNGSADGCGWTAPHSSCNNGWRASSIGWMAGAMAPTRILALPQIYNNTMAEQWKYISITGLENGHSKLDFAGPLTEYTACVLQHGGCGSLTNNSAWSDLWAQLRSDSRISPSSLPYGTDLRVN